MPDEGDSKTTGEPGEGPGEEAARTRASDQRSAVRRMLWGTVVAVAATAGLIAVTVPLSASGDDADGGGGAGAGRGGTNASSQEPARAEAAPDQDEPGQGREPLTESEREKATKAALAGDTSLRATSENVRGEQGPPQHLTTDLTDEGDGGRTAEVYFYDYKDDTAVHKTVDLASGKVTASETSKNTQPPPSLTEARAAAALLIKDKLGEGLRADYQRARGEELTRDTQLAVRGLTYRPHDDPSGPLASCGQERCVRLFTRVKGGPWIDTKNFVINLSDRSVHRIGTD
ncbi:Tat pathway signal sequence domain protein [Streptomyces sp. NPDC048172]|uniref:Tat pathway signal sequence domain protein n=1 Tax=Streptomyces sp. NPDC048172 TaxID=3365505 RepID=UPI00371B78C8